MASMKRFKCFWKWLDAKPRDGKILEQLEMHMATIDDQLAAQTALLQQVLTAVQAIQPGAGGATDLSPVLTAVGNVQTKVDAVAAKLPV